MVLFGRGMWAAASSSILFEVGFELRNAAWSICGDLAAFYLVVLLEEVGIDPSGSSFDTLLPLVLGVWVAVATGGHDIADMVFVVFIGLT